MVDNKRLFGLPTPPPADFNRIAKQMFQETAPTWDDKNNDGSMTLDELSLPATYAPVVPSPQKAVAVWPKGFENMFREVSEAYRQERVKRELSLTIPETIKTNFSEWLSRVPASVGVTAKEIPFYKEGMKALVRVAPIMHELFQNQVGYSDEMQWREGPRASEEGFTQDDLELINRYGHPWCFSDQGPSCVALPTQPERTTGLYPPEGKGECEPFNNGLTAFANPFSAVVYENGAYQSIPYATYYQKKQSAAAGLLREAAAAFAQIPREKLTAEYLAGVADAFGNNAPFPYLKSDETWRQHGKSDSIIFVRVGPDETGGDGLGDACQSKARFHMNVGLKSFESRAFVEKYKPYLQEWEDEAAQLIGNPAWYVRREAMLNLPEFWDVILAVGDDIGGPNGTNIGQTLPNWCGEDGSLEPCERNIMIYTNKTRIAYKDSLTDKYLKPLFNPDTHQYFAAEAVDIDCVVLHELTHNVGPMQGKPKPNGETTFETPLGKWKGTFEEGKAESGVISHAGGLLKKAREKFARGEISKDEIVAMETWFRRAVNYVLAWDLKMILRATRNGKFEGNLYSRLAAIQFGMMNESGAATFDPKNGWWSIDYEKMIGTGKAIEQKTMRLYAEGNFEKVDPFVKNYIEGEGFKLLHADRINKVAGKMPSILPRYEVVI